MSLSRSESARINGAKSRGPKTPEGKARSSQNAITHGIFAQVVVLQNEDADLFEELTQQFVRRFEPRDGVELALVEQMVAATWRLSRCWELQTQTMNLEMENDQYPGDESVKARAFHATIGNSPAMKLLHRFENSYERTINRAIRTLANLRKNFPQPDAGEQKCENEPKTNQSPDRPIPKSPIPIRPIAQSPIPNDSMLQSPDHSITRSPILDDDDGDSCDLW